MWLAQTNVPSINMGAAESFNAGSMVSNKLKSLLKFDSEEKYE